MKYRNKHYRYVDPRSLTDAELTAFFVRGMQEWRRRLDEEKAK